jgi:hypothetical protein
VTISPLPLGGALGLLVVLTAVVLLCRDVRMLSSSAARRDVGGQGLDPLLLLKYSARDRVADVVMCPWPALWT